MRFLFADFELDLDNAELRRAGVPLKAEPTVLRLLEVLVSSEGKLVTKEELLARVWDGRAMAENVITVAVARLRKVLGQQVGQRNFVLNVHGRGYRFVCPVALVSPKAKAPQLLLATKPFVGRERLLATLASALADADAGHGNACVLTGVPGIGKTRALEMFESQAVAAGKLVVWGHCRESEDTPPLWPFAQILRRLRAWSAKGDPHADPAAWAAELPALAMLLPELAPGRAANELDGVGGETAGRLAKHQLFDAIIRLLTRKAAQRTCVIVLDDLHRADAASLELLHSWIDELPRARILLLAAFPRLEQARTATRAQLAHIHGHRNTTRLALKPLSEADVASYVSALVEGPSSELAHAVFVKSEGNPFFMNELVRQLGSSERATRDLAVPEAALQLVRRRLAVLDEAARGALSYAAVIGRRFELSTLQAVTGQDARALMTSLDAALVSDVVVRVGDSATTFMFAHDLLRLALRDALTPVHLRNSHLRVALALEEHPLVGHSSVADLAFHFHAALPESDLRKTVQYCRAAAMESIYLFAHADGRRHLRHARQALELMDRPSLRLRFDMLLREALLARECMDAEFEPLIREVVRLARELEAPQLAVVAIMLNLNPGFPALWGSREVLEQALAALAPDAPMRAAVLARLATSAPLAYDAQACGEQIARALEIAQHSSEEMPRLVARSAQLYLVGGALDQTQANDAMQALVPLSQQLAGRICRTPMLLDFHRAIRSLQTGDMAGVHAAFARCDAASRKLGEHELDWYVARARAVLRIQRGAEQGGARAGVHELQALYKGDRRSTPPGSVLFQAYDQCVVSAEVASLSTKELLAALAPDSADSPNFCSLKVRALARAGMHDEAHGQLRAISPERIPRLPRDRDYLGTLAALAHATVDLQANEYFDPLYRLLAEYPEHFAADASFCCEPVSQLMKLLARSQGGARKRE